MHPSKIFWLVCSLALPMRAQDVVISTPKITVIPNQVNVLAIVRDKKGAPITTLSKSDFTLQADRHPQTILTAEPAGNTPLTVGLLFDTSRIAATLLDDEREAAASFLNKTLSQGNKAFLVEFASQVKLVEDTTAETPVLQRGLKALTPAPVVQQTAVSAPNDPNNTAKPRNGTTLYDSIFLSTDEITGKLPNRRVLVLLTDGIDKNSKETIASAIESAQRADTVIYALYVQGDDRKLAQESSRRNNDPTQQTNPNQRGSNSGNTNCPTNSGSGYPRFPGGGGGLPGGTGGYPTSPGTGGSNGNCPTSKPTGADHKPYVDGHAVLDRICGETGGHVYDVSRHDTVEQAFDRIAEDLKAQYRLTFVPANLDTTRDHYHEIDLALAGPLAKSKPQFELRDGFYNNAKPD